MEPTQEPHQHDEQLVPLASADQVAELKSLLVATINLLCPKCRPAEIARMHPELVAQAGLPEGLEAPPT